MARGKLQKAVPWVSSQSLHHSWRVSFSLESEKLSLAQAGHGHSPPTIQGSAYLQRVLAKTSGMIMKVSLFLSCDQETGGHVQKVAIKFLPPSHHTITCVTHSKNVYEDVRNHCSWATVLGQGRSFDGDLGSFAVKDVLAFRFITGETPVSCLDFPHPPNCPPACTSSPCPSLWWMRPHVLTSSPYSCTCSLTSPEPGTLLPAWVLASTSTQSILTPESNWSSPSLPSGLCSKLSL